MDQETILIVDDNRQLADFIAKSLLPSLGYQCRTAYSGKAALHLLQTFRPSLLLLDLELPDTTGLDLLRQFKNMGCDFPTILFTAHGSEQIVVEAFRLGVHDYLIKPAEPEELEAAIASALVETRLRQETTRLTAELEDQVSWLKAVSKIGQSLTSTLDTEEVLRRIVEAAVQLTGADDGFLGLLDASSGQLYLRATNTGQESQIKLPSLMVKDSLIGETLSLGRPVRRTSESASPDVKVSTGFLVYSLVHVPIFSKGHPLGVLSVNNRQRQRAFNQKDENKLALLADFAAVALENANLYQQARYEISERKRIETALRESEERYALAVQGANDGIWDLNLRGNTIYFSPRWKAMLGYEENEISPDPQEWFKRVHPQDIVKLKADLSAHIRGTTPHFENEYRMLHRDGNYRWMLSRGLAVRDPSGGAGRVAGSQTDISQRKQVESRLQHDAFYDKLTGLPNRALLMERLGRVVEFAQRFPDYQYAVLFLDLDQFKNVNDSLGHPAGDQLLVEVAQMLKTGLKSVDTVARLGGDEFVILLDDIADSAAAIAHSETVLRLVSTPIKLGQSTVFISTSIGIIFGNSAYKHADDVLRDADIAMYAAKGRGKATYAVFDPQMRASLLKRVVMQTDLQQALEKQQLKVYYQPILALEDGQIVGLEALVHWQHPELGLLPGSEFIPVALEAGMVPQIDWLVCEEACRQTHEWQQRQPDRPAMKIHVNMTSLIIARSNLVERVQQILARTGLSPLNLELEITEGAAMAYQSLASSVLAELKKLGIRVQLDDFGAGTSSLLHLTELAFSAIKIDRAFIRKISGENSSLAVPRMVVTLAHELNMDAVAGGIETVEQLHCLRNLGCDHGQGFLFCKPLESGQIAKLLAHPQDDLPWRRLWEETSVEKSR